MRFVGSLAALVVASFAVSACTTPEGAGPTGGASAAPSGSASAAPVAAVPPPPPEKPKPKHAPRTLVAGGLHTCFVMADKSVKCWGENSFAQLGIGSEGPGNKKTKPETVKDLADVRDIVAGPTHTCAIHGEAGALACWGRNDNAQVSSQRKYSVNETQNTPVAPKAFAGYAVSMGLGTVHSCAVEKDGHVRCWGMGISGELGTEDSLLFGDSKPVIGVEDVIDIAASGGQMWGHTCALFSTGRVRCWGNNWHGELGTGKVSDPKEPKKDSATPADAKSDAGPDKSKLPPTEPVAGVEDVIQIAAGPNGSCAVTRAGRVHCWGSVAELVGADPKKDRKLPEPKLVEALQDARQIGMGSGFACAIVEGGKVKCWGYNFAGQLGKPADKDKISPPEEVADVADAVEIAVGFEHVCVRRKDNAVLCWGGNSSGQLGTGDTSKSRHAPKPVLL